MGNYFPVLLLISVVFVVITSVANSSNGPTVLLSSEPDPLIKLSNGCPAPDPKLNYRPVIGIVSHPGDGAGGHLSNATDVSYIAASYVKFVESAGARVIPLIYNEPTQTLNKKLNLVNGVVFPGGSFDKGDYFEVLKVIFQKVIERNDGGENFPLLAINLGFQLLTIIVSKWGVSPESFRADADLDSFFNVLTTSLDKDNKVYVSTIQAKKYPVVAVQWSPERNAFEWALSEIPHTEDAIIVSQSVANYFISEARKSINVPDNQDILDNLIYNYSPSYSGKDGSGFDEVYIFS